MNALAPQASPQDVREPVTGARLVVEALEREGVRHIFGYPGGAIMPVYDALPGSSLNHILVRHEQAAALAADAYGRVTGEPGVCIATSGPGATNLVTGIANAFMDSVPMVAITGQVARPLIGTDAFQEVDIFGITLPIVKHSYVIRRTEDIPAVFAEAFALARSGRPGPVLIDLPKDVAMLAGAPEPFELEPAPSAPLDDAAIAAANRLIAEAQAPVLYFGGGIAIARAEQALRAFAERTGMPSVATLKGLGGVPTDAPTFLGMLGMHGTRAANVAIDNCDLLICVGARFDDRATGKLDTFAPTAKVVHIDGDPAEIGKLRRAEVGIAGDLGAILDRLTASPDGAAGWKQRCAEQKKMWAASYDAPGNGVYVPAMLKELSEAAGDSAIFTCDVGQHQMWVAQHCRFSRPQAHLTSAGLGTMGYGVPAGIGALLADPDATVITVSGDGSIMMNIHELATLRRYRLPLKIVLIDNAQLGMVRQWQELFFEENFSEVDLSDNPDFADVARSFGIEAFTIDHRSEVPGAIERLLNTAGPILCHV
ncbi:MAG TPA: acetolactate synthase 2 catalytic subunit, partial [Allosphingosinicella sp.]